MTIRRSGHRTFRASAPRHAACLLAAGLGASLLGSTANGQIIIGGASQSRPAVVVDLSVLTVPAAAATEPTVVAPTAGTRAAATPAATHPFTPPRPDQKPSAASSAVAAAEPAAEPMPAAIAERKPEPKPETAPPAATADEPPAPQVAAAPDAAAPIAPPTPLIRPETPTPPGIDATPAPRPEQSAEPDESVEPTTAEAPTKTEQPAAAEAPTPPQMAERRAAPDAAEADIERAPTEPAANAAEPAADAPAQAQPDQPEEAQVAAVPKEPASIDMLPDGGFTIAFDPGSEELSPSGGRLLSGLAQRLMENEELRLQVRAYAGGTPETASQARRLSLNRALAVRTFLIDRGVRGTRIDVRALGNTALEGSQDRVDLQFSD
ncbi:MAG TPA: OmpA family protein [Alphaproteobacteria bacterium]|nr:OmpA family protein [Alphaproteobacteria bacterium]